MPTISITLDTCPFCGGQNLSERYDHLEHNNFLFCPDCKGRIIFIPGRREV